MKILLDTNFLLTCLKQKIDFESIAEERFSENIEWIIPLEITEELVKIKENKGKTIDKNAADLALQLISKLKADKIKLGNQKVDDGIVNYLNKNNEIVLATLDKDLKKRVKNRILTIKNKKSLGIA
jgi:rRNA-processing protein FCF1